MHVGRSRLLRGIPWRRGLPFCIDYLEHLTAAAKDWRPTLSMSNGSWWSKKSGIEGGTFLWQDLKEWTEISAELTGSLLETSAETGPVTSAAWTAITVPWASLQFSTSRGGRSPDGVFLLVLLTCSGNGHRAAPSQSLVDPLKVDPSRDDVRVRVQHESRIQRRVGGKPREWWQDSHPFRSAGALGSRVAAPWGFSLLNAWQGSA